MSNSELLATTLPECERDRTSSEIIADLTLLARVSAEVAINRTPGDIEQPLGRVMLSGSVQAELTKSRER